MSRVRVGRVAEQIKKELSQIVQQEMKDPRLGFITVTGVELSNDLAVAKVFLSVLGEETQQLETLNALTRATGFLRSELGRRIRLRHTPELTFKLDHSTAYGSHIERLIQDINKESKSE